MEITRIGSDTIKQDIATLFVEHGEQLRGFIMKYAHNVDLVDDIAQSTYLEALKSWQQFRGHAKLKNWLFGIAYNLVRNQNRINCKQPDHVPIDNLPTQIIHDGSELQDKVDSIRILQRCPTQIGCMPGDMQKVFNHIVVEGLSYEEVAAELGIAVGTVRSRLSRARNWLKVSLDQTVNPG
ncbi:RNA polymerase sigma factor [Vibrio nigripulchritudo MADA3029]|uniref:RNA polymerase sigma factor n=1 Tax=Vibrio nigripulchritudo TaxID=28173 RepID=UPI0003B1810A|nr:RNA polymerase sigma factor [Vibrio nigripulchritudo]CCN50878.1 RNA polymerase sigma factor [Vibrio nigripulchritudo MADA3020]CCN56736.1 RNA polymerase sigma factor [Vibrio nigripulchritudo MADA3021]CCN62593.1 RNA polymerase sigma factor [Vibrio nigripulchritudo MADA3029]BDU41166.1 RNA polymerase sigma factor [Vibrio nigripulchritudo]BDU46931.1 RNA polymerase sigma factor [Vibrio nigripulchritudo]